MMDLQVDEKGKLRGNLCVIAVSLARVVVTTSALAHRCSKRAGLSKCDGLECVFWVYYRVQ